MAPTGPEQRRYARIETSIVCEVATPGGAFEAAIVNLSRTGAAFLGPDGAANADDSVTLMLERVEGQVSLALHAHVVRTEEQEERTLYGVEFEPLPPGDDEQLRLLLQLVSAAHGQGRREHPRVAARVEVTCRTEDIFRGWVADLSKGGLSIRCARPVAVGQSLTVSFGLAGLRGLVEITGQVVNSLAGERGHRLGVRFSPLSDDETAQVNRALDLLLGISLPDAELVEDD